MARRSLVSEKMVAFSCGFSNHYLDYFSTTTTSAGGSNANLLWTICLVAFYICPALADITNHCITSATIRIQPVKPQCIQIAMTRDDCVYLM